jgi:hypothetical protein
MAAFPPPPSRKAADSPARAAFAQRLGQFLFSSTAPAGRSAPLALPPPLALLPEEPLGILGTSKGQRGW